MSRKLLILAGYAKHNLGETIEVRSVLTRLRALNGPDPLHRQRQPRAAAAGVFAILEREGAAMAFSDLPAQHESDSRSPGLGRKERHEQVRGIREPGSFIFHCDFQSAPRSPPADGDTTARVLGVVGIVVGVLGVAFGVLAGRRRGAGTPSA